MKYLKGQGSTEFLIVVTLVLLLFSITTMIYFMSVNHANAVEKTLKATEVCISVSTAISSFASFDGNSSFNFSLANEPDDGNYTVWINSKSKIVRVEYGSGGISCKIQTSNLTNSTGATFFELEKNATMNNNAGVLVIEP